MHKQFTFQLKTVQLPIESFEMKWTGTPKSYINTPEVLFRVFEHPAQIGVHWDDNDELVFPWKIDEELWLQKELVVQCACGVT